ncbi:hypothetical protein VPH35_137621 [Triticum aestivum]|uniref:Uncharacterized protein n=1 Tax=Triticum aestivum TaxID=4565 RepID=A0A3B6TKA9_WHEAT
MRASGKRLCQMVHDAGLRHGTEDRLQTVFATGWWMAAVDANYDSQLDQMIVATTKFTILKKLGDDIAVLLQPMRPSSSLPATLIGLHGQNLFQALVALRLPADATKNVHLEVALAARRLALQEFVDLHIHMYEQIVYIGIYKAIEDATTLAFLNRLEALDAFAEKHLDLATKAAAP